MLPSTLPSGACPPNPLIRVKNPTEAQQQEQGQVPLWKSQIEDGLATNFKADLAAESQDWIESRRLYERAVGLFSAAR